MTRFVPKDLLQIGRICLAWCCVGWGGATRMVAAEKDDFGWMDLEQLGKIKVTTASKRAEPAWNVGAALSVVTGNDVRLSGARTLGDALRLAPGLSVAQVDARDWMVGARGFDQQFANKLLVMIDGRSIYTPLFGGVSWDLQDIVLEDLAQIEVVRGPGAAIWGANAVNGVVNIVTKSAAETTGSYVSTTLGGAERSGTVRHGAALSGGWAYRVYARAARYGATLTADGADAGDAWNRRQFGFRADRAAPDGAKLTLQGDAYDSVGNFVAQGAEFAPPRYGFVDNVTGIHTQGANLLARWDNVSPDGAGLRVQTYLDSVRRAQAVITERRTTFDLDVQQTGLVGANIWSWGAGYRASGDRAEAGRGLAVEPERFTADLFSVFAQDQIALVDDRLDLLVGLRAEHNDFTGLELQPNVRLIWHLGEASVAWMAVSRAVRSPTRLETGVRLDVAALPPGARGTGSPATRFRYEGRPDIRSETLQAFEAGWRGQPSAVTSVELTAFLHDYRDLVDIGPSTAPRTLVANGDSYLLVPLDYRNTLRGASYGSEAAVAYQPTPQLRWSAGYTFTRVTQSGQPGGENEAYFEASTPRHAGFIRARFVPLTTVNLEVNLRLAGARDAIGVPAFSTVDARAAWSPRPDFELELRGENLGDPAHAEFREGLSNRTFQLRRSVSLRLTFRR